MKQTEVKTKPTDKNKKTNILTAKPKIVSIILFFVFIIINSWINPHINLQNFAISQFLTVQFLIVLFTAIISGACTYFISSNYNQLRSEKTSPSLIFTTSICSLIILILIGGQIFFRVVWLSIGNPDSWGRSLTALGASFSSLIAVIGVITTVSISQTIENEKIKQNNSFEQRKATREIISDLNDRYIEILKSRTSKDGYLRSFSNFALASLYQDWEKLNETLDKKLDQKDHQQNFILKTIFSKFEPKLSSEEVGEISEEGEEVLDFESQQMLVDILLPPEKQVESINLSHSRLIDLDLTNRQIGSIILDKSEIDTLKLIETSLKKITLDSAEVNGLEIESTNDLNISLKGSNLSRSSIDLRNYNLDISCDKVTFLDDVKISNAKINNFYFESSRDNNMHKISFINCDFTELYISGDFKSIEFYSCRFVDTKINILSEPIKPHAGVNRNDIPALQDEFTKYYTSSILFKDIDKCYQKNIKIQTPTNEFESLYDYLNRLDEISKNVIIGQEN